MALFDWQNICDGGNARFVGVKSVWEIQILNNTPQMGPTYVRRRVTYVTLELDMEYGGALVDGSAAKTWMQGVHTADAKDYLTALTWGEPGSGSPTYTLTPWDNDGKGLPMSGKWIVDSKELILLPEGAITIRVTVRSESAWISDVLR